MRIDSIEIKIYEISHYILGKAIFRQCQAQKISSDFYKDFYNTRKPSEAFRLKYCEKKTANEVAALLYFSEGKNIYRKIDNDMLSFGVWLSNDCKEASAFESIRKQLENILLSESQKRNISINDKKGWAALTSDCLKLLS